MPQFCNVEFAKMTDIIKHRGIVENINGFHIRVKIVQTSACSACSVKGHCNASESKEKIIEVPDNSGKFHINEEVQLCGQSSLGLQAVLLAFVFPLIIVFAAIVTGTSMQWEETTSGLTGLLLLVPYYCILYFLRDKLKKRFIFTLKKLN